MTVQSPREVKGFIAQLRRGWSDYQAHYAWAAERALPAVREPAGFYSRVFGLGQIPWSRTTLGPKIYPAFLIETARKVFDSYFLPATAPARAEFQAFLVRAQGLDGLSPNHHRKRVLRTLLEASLLPPGELASFFAAQIHPEEIEAIQRYRETRQREIVASFSKEVPELISAQAAQAAGRRYNIAGVILTGSHAYGSSVPGSDLDVFLLTWDGSGQDVPEFVAALEERRTERDWPHWNGDGNGPTLVVYYGIDSPRPRRLVQEFPSLVLTPYEEVTKSFAGLSGTRAFWRPTLWQKGVHRLTSPLIQSLFRFALG